MDTTGKFDGRAEDYTSARPNYAAGLIDCLYSDYGFSPSSSIADIGSGTGKFAVHLLDRGSTVYCVEPNDDMRYAAERSLMDYGGFRSVKGDADNTTLENASIDFVTTAQAFHWFNVQSFKAECKRILRDNGKVALIWNVRDENARVNSELHDIFDSYCPDFVGFSGGIKKDDPRIKEFFDDSYDYVRFDNPLYLDRWKFISRCLSASYSLKVGDELYPQYIKKIEELFDSVEENGIATIPNSSVAYIGTIR